MTEYKPIDGYNGLYHAGSDGTIWSTWRGGWFKKSSRFETDGTGRRKGHLRITLTLDGRNKHVLVHRLIAQTFLPNPDNKPQVNHIDGDTRNNKLDNLEWSTQSENQLHAYNNGLQKWGEGRPNSVLTVELVKEIRRLEGKNSPKEVGLLFNISAPHVRDIWARRMWKRVDEV